MKSSFIAALLALAVAIPGLAQSAASHATYRDDPIVRDLKAGKLTVREARLLQEQRAARQQQGVAKARQPQVAQKKTKTAKPTAAHVSNKTRQRKQGQHRHADKQIHKHGWTRSQSHKVAHPVSPHHKAPVRKKRPLTH